MKALIRIGLVCLWLLACSTQALADSYVFITNSTPETVSVDVHHSGDRTLDEGDEWQQEATQIGPWETKRVLRFNRYSGLRSGANYQFETRVSNGADTVVMAQTLRGTWYGSTIRHGARSDDFQSPWYSDREIHTFDTRFATRESSSSFKAKFTGGYDDFHYTLHDKPVVEAASAGNGLKVLTYNIWALPLLATRINDRLDGLPEHLSGYDVLLLQEVFGGKRDEFLERLAQEYPYQTEVLNAPGINLFDGGVMIASRWPIVSQADYVFPGCAGTDCFSERGVTYVQVIKQGKAYHLTGTHTASSDSDEARALRQEQFRQIRSLADAQNIPASEPLLMGGDFNVNKLRWAGDYADMLQNLGAEAPLSTGYTASTYDPRINQNISGSLAGGSSVEYLDYVVYARDHRQPLESRNDVRVFRSLNEPLWGVWDLSDHFPVLGDFSF